MEPALIGVHLSMVPATVRTDSDSSLLSQGLIFFYYKRSGSRQSYLGVQVHDAIRGSNCLSVSTEMFSACSASRYHICFQGKYRGSEEQEMHAISLHKFLQLFSGQKHVTWLPIAARESGKVIFLLGTLLPRIKLECCS